jgi:hypothetical protein
MTVEDMVAEMIISLASDAIVAMTILVLSKDYIKSKVNEIVEICIQDARERNMERIREKKRSKNESSKEQVPNDETLPGL